MRILIVTPWFPSTARRESGIFVEREARALAAEHEVVVLHLDWNDSPGEVITVPDARVVRHRLNRANPLDHLRARALVRRAARGADVVHTHALTGLIPWLIGRPAPRPWVHTEHWSGLTAPETLSRGEALMLRALSPALARPDVVVAECERLAAAVRARRSGPVAIVPCVVPEVTVVDPPASDTLRLIAVGGLIPRKGPLIAVAAVAELHRRAIPASLVWVGAGPLADEVVAAAEAAGIADAVTLTGALAAPEVSERYDAADIFILPTQGDNFCVVTAEALVHGRPVVSGANTGAVDYAEPSVSAFVTSTDPVAYADAVAAVCERTRDLSARQIADTVAGRFSPALVAEELTTIYRTLT